jgi:protein O-GlcNAc transferase
MFQRLLNRLARVGDSSSRLGEEVSRSRARADALIELGDEAEKRGDVVRASGFYRQAAEVAPGYARGHLNLGVALEALGNVAGAVAAYEAALMAEPGHAYASYNLGKLLYGRGELDRAERLLRSALERKADFAEAQVVLAGVYEARGELREAAQLLEEALRQRPDWAGALSNYGALLRKLNRLEEAERVLRRAIALDAQNGDAWHELGEVLRAQGELEQAQHAQVEALKCMPESQEVHRALFYVHEARGDHAGAVAVLEGALARWPSWADALRHYGAVLKRLHRLGEAEAALRRALAIEPDNAATHQVLGVHLLSEARVAEALECFGKARALEPANFALESAELFTLNLYDGISTEELFSRHKSFGERIERAYPARFAPFANVRDPERRLRIGYLSGDFNSNPVSLFLIPLLERHDPSVCEVFCYSVGTVVDDFTRQVKSQPVTWRECAALSDVDLAERINGDAIDILIDLSGHSRETRLAVFAQQPAPVQASWLGYLSTTGMTRMHYRLCDAVSDPEGTAEAFHTETLHRLPRAQWCYRPRAALDYTAAAEPPSLASGCVTFGSFNAAPKLSQTVRELWAEILRALPDSRLLIVGAPAEAGLERLLKDFGRLGIASSRITPVGQVSLQEYFRCFNRVDIALDTTPYSGGTTTCDTLWMGVPVVTVPGSRPVSRSTASVLTSMGLTDWIAASPEDYMRLAIQRASDGITLQHLRKTLRQRMLSSPLMDEVAFARSMEDAYRSVWRAWCAGKGTR